MRYIDDMLMGIPLEEMTGGTDMKDNEIKAVIPDIPAAPQPDNKENTAKDERKITDIPAGAEEKSIKPVRVRRRGLSVLAAALALVIAAGGVLTYLGGVKKVGPLASLFDKNSSEQADKIDTSEEEKLKANRNAKTVFVALNGYCADLIADGRISEMVKGQVTSKLSELSEVDATLGAMFKDIMRDVGLDDGEIAFFIDPDTLKPKFAQWRSGEGGYAGQYPEPSDGIEFGKFKESYDGGNGVTVGEIGNETDEKKMANKYAKLMFTLVSGYVADMVSDGHASQIKAGQFTFTFPDVSQFDQKLADQLTEVLKDEPTLDGSEVTFYIDPQRLMPTAAQWRKSADGYVGQYPEPAEGLVFGDLGKSAETDENGDITVNVYEDVTSFDNYGTDSSGTASMPRETALKLIAAYNDTAEKYGTNPWKSKIYGPQYTMGFKVDGTELVIQSSDKAGIPLMVNCEYCSCEELERVFYDYWMNNNSVPSTSVISSGDTITDKPLSDERAEKAAEWYRSFKAANYEAVKDLGSENGAVETKYAKLKVDGDYVIVVNTKYKNANIQVNGEYYNVEDTSIFDIIDQNCASDLQ